jgi:N-acetylglucosaminyl-diphospho-decaprenol L-rhamnosyltransferase
MADVTVCIVNHESRESVLAMLGALRSSLDLQVVVVDNASQDGSVEAIRERFPSVEVVARTDRGGYGANHNMGLTRAVGRHVLFLNDDARVEPHAIEALVAVLDADPRAGVACPTIVDEHGATTPSLWPRPSAALDVRQALRLGRPVPARHGEVGWAMGCALLVRADAARAAGGFDEGYYMYSEEVDLCVRLADAGWRIVAVPAAVVVHAGQASTGGHASPERAVEMARSRRRYWDVHYGRAGRLVARAAVIAQFAALALAARLRGARDDAAAMWLQAVGCWRDPPGRPGLRERASEFNRARAA